MRPGDKEGGPGEVKAQVAVAHLVEEVNRQHFQYLTTEGIALLIFQPLLIINKRSYRIR